jgi:hypothetical protein
MKEIIIPIGIAIIVYFAINNKFVAEKLGLKDKYLSTSKYILYALLIVMFFFKQLVKLGPLTLVCGIVVVGYLVFKAYSSFRE